MERYEHRQLGTLMLIVLVIIAAVYAFTSWADSATRVIPAIVVIILAGFVQLTTRVDERSVRWSFTFGFPAGEIPIGDIESAAVTQTNLLEGWGIHWTIWHGWLWNVSGFQAVEIYCAGGKRVTIGTDDPQGFCAAIERFRKG